MPTAREYDQMQDELTKIREVRMDKTMPKNKGAYAHADFKDPKVQIGVLENIKKRAGSLSGTMPSANMRDRARKIYDLAKELQDDLSK